MVSGRSSSGDWTATSNFFLMKSISVCPYVIVTFLTPLLREGYIKLGADQCKVSHVSARCAFDIAPGILVRDDDAKARLRAQVGEIGVIMSVLDFCVFPSTSYTALGLSTRAKVSNFLT
jgi:hypothetical protein